ncbi:MAG: hypothetical protein IJO76_05300, partial [Clostridia bacterium]|nr:hypothetical protein [Clostridia bacterium]
MNATFSSAFRRFSKRAMATVSAIALLSVMLLSAMPAVLAASPNSQILVDFDRKQPIKVDAQENAISTIVANPTEGMGDAIKWEQDTTDANTGSKVIPYFAGSGRANDTAIAIWVTVGSTSPWINLHLYEAEAGDESHSNDGFGLGNTGVTYYTMDAAGALTENTVAAGTTTFRLPVGFNGWLILPYASFVNKWTDGDNGVLDPDAITAVDFYYNDGFHHEDPIYIDQITAVRDINEFALYVNGGDMSTAANFVVDFDGNMYTSKDAGTAGWTEGEGYGLSGNGLKWEPSVSVTKMSFAATGNANDEAFVFWMSGEDIQWASPREIQMYLYDLDGNRCYHLDAGATYYRLSDNGVEETMTVSNSKFIQLNNGFSGWYIIPLSSLTITWGPTFDTHPYTGGMSSIQLYNEWPAPNTIYMDNLGFTGDIDLFKRIITYEGPVCDSVNVPVNYVVDFDEAMYTGKTGDGWTEQDSAAFSGNALKWEANGSAIMMNLNGTGDAADEAFVFWMSGEDIQWASPREIQIFLYDLDGNRCLQLSSGATYYRISDDGVKETKTVNTNQHVELENGFSGWYIIPLANLSLSWGPELASRPMEVGSIDQVRFYNAWPNPTTFYIDNLGFSNDVDGFMAAAEAGVIDQDGAVQHTWLEATCTEPKVCEYCGETEGEALGHNYSADCDTTCNACGDEREVEVVHQYFNACDKVCMVCYEETNPDAAHNVVHVEALDPTCSALGNIEHWYCDICGAAWTDADQTQVTTLKSVKLGTVDHNYVDGACKWCGEADPNAPADELVSTEVYGGITFDVYEKADGTHKLVISGQTKMGGWTNRNAYQYAATITEVVV